MLDFTVRFILATLKFIFKVTLIIGGLIFSSFGNAISAFLSAEEAPEEEEVENNKTIFVCDKASAINAFAAGEINEAQLARFWTMKDK